jgi:hypothetical protein
VVRQFAPAQAVLFFRQHDDGAAFGRFVRERRELGGVRQFLHGHAGQGDEFRRLSVAQGNGPGLV